MKKNNNIIIGVLLIIILALLILVGFLFFNKKEEDKPVKEEPVEVNKIILDDTNKEIFKNVKLKLVNSTLYINDKQTNIMFEGTIHVIGKYALITPAGQLGYLVSEAVDEKGNIISVNKDMVLPLYSDNINYQVNDIRVENNKVIADFPLYIFCTEEDETKCSTKVEFTFNNGITMKEYK